MHASGRYKSIVTSLLLACFWALCPAQKVDALLTPIDKAVQVGRPFQVEIRVTHPSDVVVIFPDSARDFTPYEVHSGKAIPTETAEGESEDAKIYKLYTWEIDSIQYLQFPVRYVVDGDTETVMTNREAVMFQPVIAVYSDSLQVQLHENLVEIEEPINWVAILIILGILIVVGVLAGIGLSPSIAKWWRRRKIEREWRRFKEILNGIPAKIGQPETYISELNRIWKTYYDRDWKRALASLTTRELQGALPKVDSLDAQDREILVELSASADRILYAEQPIPEDQMRNLHGQVARIMEKEYQRRKEAAEL